MQLRNLKYLARGHRSIVYTARFNGRIVAVKKRRIDIDVSNHLLNEAGILKKLNKHKIGPKIYHGGRDMIVMEYAKGDRILEWLEKNRGNKKLVKKMINELLRQCRVMDKMKIEKKEMHKPLKHVIIGKKLTLIDFERARIKEKPGNVTQASQFLIRLGMMRRDIKALRDYKKEQSERNFNVLKRLLLVG